RGSRARPLASALAIAGDAWRSSSGGLLGGDLAVPRGSGSPRQLARLQPLQKPLSEDEISPKSLTDPQPSRAAFAPDSRGGQPQRAADGGQVVDVGGADAAEGAGGGRFTLGGHSPPPCDLCGSGPALAGAPPGRSRRRTRHGRGAAA